ncbi:MAG TPA: glutamate-5-semialdehyde dehydrogenase [Acidimicrobiales bacterium]
MQPSDLGDLARRVRVASRQIAGASSAVRDEALRTAADLLTGAGRTVLDANAADLDEARRAGADPTSLDRLALDEGRITAMADALRAVAALDDPLGEVVAGGVRPNGLRVQRVRVPLGVVGVIYENRPNVTTDAAALCLKAGNAAFLRGSASALRSNLALVGVLREAVTKAGLPPDVVALVEAPGHEVAVAFMRLRGLVDCLIPRGGPGLVATMVEQATVPYVLDGAGNCHVYVDRAADLAMAGEIVLNAKTQRPGVCNAAESLLVHRDVADRFLPAVSSLLEGVDLVGDEAARKLVPTMGAASDDDFAAEFLGMKLSVAVVDGLDQAIEHIARFGSGHSEAIVTGDLAAAERFVREVDAAAVLVNASTRFVDGYELGLGAEVGISTQKLHARGPMGLRELTSVKWIVRGEGQVRR